MAGSKPILQTHFSACFEIYTFCALLHHSNLQNVVKTSVVKLSRQQYKQNPISFINDIVNYGQKWFEYDLKILDIISKKNKFVVYYEWEGVLFENGPTYSYRAMEIIKVKSSNNRIKSIDALWTEKQFKDQFILTR